MLRIHLVYQMFISCKKNCCLPSSFFDCYGVDSWNNANYFVTWMDGNQHMVQTNWHKFHCCQFDLYPTPSLYVCRLQFWYFKYEIWQLCNPKQSTYRSKFFMSKWPFCFDPINCFGLQFHWNLWYNRLCVLLSSRSPSKYHVFGFWL